MLRLLVSTVLLSVLLSSCGEPKQGMLPGDVYTLTLEKAPSSFPENEIFTFEFKLAGAAAGLRIEADCTMPGHGHGMNTSPKITEIQPGHYKVEGMQLHMPGEWLLQLNVFDKDKQVESFRYKFNI